MPEHDAEHDEDALRYHPPFGQDPAVVVAEVQKAGYVATVETSADGAELLLITSPDGRAPDREHVRRVLGEIDQVNFEGDTASIDRPQFLDE